MKASAFVVGQRDGASASLADLARAIGFQSVERYQGLVSSEKQLEQTPLVYFLCAAVADVRSLKPMADAIRFSPSLKLRFSPMIYFARDLSLDSIRQCILMGFDDVIALPYGGGDMSERIFRHIGKATTYYETATYFGPDRRNRLGNIRSLDSDHGGGQYRRIEILRTQESGVNVLRDDFEVVV